MKIKRVSWRNYRNLRDGQINCDGHNVVISGRNGVGKSSIASIVPFVLFGRATVKGFDESGATVNSQMPEAEIEFDNGRKFTRNVTADNKSHVYIDGQPVTSAAFNARVYQMTNGAGNLLFDPFEFPNMHWTKQRDFLLTNFATPEELPSADELRSRLKAANAAKVELDARVKELYSQLKDIPDVDINELDAQIAAAEVELSSLQATRQLDNGKADLLRRAVTDLRNRIAHYGKIHHEAQVKREQLLAKYRAVKTTCPTCGAKIPPERVKEARDSIVEVGRKTADEIVAAKAQMDKLSAELDGVQRELASLESDARQSFDAQTTARMMTVKNNLANMRNTRARIDRRSELDERIRDLDTQRRNLREQITDLEGELMTVNSRRQQLVRKKESDVNSHFQFVTFRLFKILSSSGETRETCEAMIDGVPFASLSKGERFKAACDILNALQVKFVREMPLMIDDAESYTPNSLIKLPNQLFLFKVTDEDLKIEVQP